MVTVLALILDVGVNPTSDIDKRWIICGYISPRSTGTGMSLSFHRPDRRYGEVPAQWM